MGYLLARYLAFIKKTRAMSMLSSLLPTTMAPFPPLIEQPTDFGVVLPGLAGGAPNIGDAVTDESETVGRPAVEGAPAPTREPADRPEGDNPVTPIEASSDPFDDFDDDDFDDEFDDDFEEDWDDDEDDDGFGPEFQDSDGEEFDVNADAGEDETEEEAEEGASDGKFKGDADFDE